jgi:hypothetical protein
MRAVAVGAVVGAFLALAACETGGSERTTASELTTTTPNNGRPTSTTTSPDTSIEVVPPIRSCGDDGAAVADRVAAPPCGGGAAIMEPYPYDLLLRCGVAETITFDGSLWLADPIPASGGESLVLQATEHERDPDYARGTMTKISSTSATFSTEWGLTIDFAPSAAPVRTDC